MKSIKLLAALAIPAMFAACTNEEITYDAPQQLNKVVGAELIGSGISFNVSNGVNSRLSTKGWQGTDRIGLSWVVTTNPTTAQSIDNAPTEANWYANHMLYPENGKFTTKGNVYKGWHFAYFPFQYTETADVQTFVINPAQTQKAWVDEDGGRVNDMLFISPLKFLSKESLDDNYQLRDNVVFSVQRAANAIRVEAAPEVGSAFAGEGSMANLKVNSITLKAAAGYNIFADRVQMDVHNLPLDTASVAITTDSLYKHLYAGTQPVLKPQNRTNTITTDVSGADLVVGETNKLMTITIPETANALEAEDYVIEVAVEAGKFTIVYDEEAEEGTSAYTNNAALEALAEAYKTDGAMTKVAGIIDLDVVLYSDIFATDFGHISDLEEWNSAVTMATTLGREAQEFGVDSIIDFNGGVIPMPEGCAVTVKAASITKATPTLKISKKTLESWPVGLTSEIDVLNTKSITDATGINGKTIYNEGSMKLPAEATIASPVVNKGTISLGKLSKLEDVDNAEGRINVVYGSYVNTTASPDGIIAYTVAASEKAFRINNLIDTTLPNAANVNTLVIKSGRTLNLNLKDQGVPAGTDPYNPSESEAGAKLKSLANINIEMNGGNIVVGEVEDEETSNNQVAGVEVLGGENTITDAVPTSVNVAADAKLTVATTNALGYLNWDTTSVENNGEMTVTAKLHVSSIENNGTITATGYYVHSTNEPALNDGGTVKGIVIKCPYSSEEAEDAANIIEIAKEVNNAEGSAKVTTQAELVEALNKYVDEESKLTTYPTWNACQFIQIMKKYVDVTFGGVTNADIDALEAILGQII